MTTEFHSLRPFLGSGTLPPGAPCRFNSDKANQVTRLKIRSTSSGGVHLSMPLCFERPARRVVRLSADVKGTEPGTGLPEEGKTLPDTEEEADSVSGVSREKTFAATATERVESTAPTRPSPQSANGSSPLVVRSPKPISPKEWVNLWWPVAMAASRDNELAMLEGSKSFNAWFVYLIELMLSGMTASANEAKEGINDAKAGLRALLGYKTPAPEPAVPIRKPEEVPYVPFLPGKLGSVGLFKPFTGRTEASKPKPEIKEKVGSKTATKPKGLFQLPIMKTEETKVEADEPVAGGQQIAKRDEKREGSLTFLSPLPILQSIKGSSEGKEKEITVKEDTRTKAEMGTGPTKTPEPVSKTTDKVIQEAKSEMELPVQTSNQGSSAKPMEDQMKEVLSMDQAQQDSEASERQEVGSIVPSAVATPESDVFGTDKASTNDGVEKGEESPTAPNVVGASTPLGLGTGPGKVAAKSSGGGVGGPFNVGPRNASKASQPVSRAAGEVAVAGVGGGGGGGGGGVSSGGGGGGGGDGDGSEPGRQFPFGNLVMLSIVTAVVVTAVLWRTKARKTGQSSQGSQDAGIRMAGS